MLRFAPAAMVGWWLFVCMLPIVTLPTPGGCHGFSYPQQAVEHMRQGMSPKEACEKAIQRIAKYYPVSSKTFSPPPPTPLHVLKCVCVCYCVQTFTGGLVCLDKEGNHGAAGWNWVLSFAYRNPTTDGIQVGAVKPIGP